MIMLNNRPPHYRAVLEELHQKILTRSSSLFSVNRINLP